MEKKWKKTVIQGIICVGLVVLIWTGYFVVRGKINKDKKERAIQELRVKQDYNLLSQVETVSSEKGKVMISGWALRRNSKNQEIYLMLQSEDKEEKILLYTDCKERADVDDIMNHEYDYGETGFTAKIQEKELKKDRSYEILLVLEYEENGKSKIQKKVTTNRYIYNGELYRYQPEDFVKPEISQAEIKEVIDNGKLYDCDAEKGGWIYEYQGMMYWILDGKQFEGLKAPSVPCDIYPVHGEDVPTERMELYQMRGYDYYEIYLNDTHQVQERDKTYYVISLELPKYPISYMKTGSYGNGGTGWLYKAEFQMDITK